MRRLDGSFPRRADDRALDRGSCTGLPLVRATITGNGARLDRLLADIRRHPFTGIGKPEPLRGTLAGWWSRRITGEHRLVYRVAGKGAARQLQIAQCRYHY